MNYRRGLLSRVKVDDRVAVTLLRGGDSPRATMDLRHAFSALRDRAVSSGLEIRPVDAVAVGPCEWMILGWLATWQRSRLEPAIEEWRVAARELQICAQLLAEAGFRLDYHNVARGKLAEGEEPASRAGLTDPHMSNGEASRLKHRILSELAEKGPMRMADLQSLGASRQTVRNMVRRGHLRRLRYGVYALLDDVPSGTGALMHRGDSDASV